MLKLIKKAKQVKQEHDKAIQQHTQAHNKLMTILNKQ